MKSPCKICKEWSSIFPKCLKKCKLIKKFQDFLITGVQDHKVQYMETETHRIGTSGIQKKPFMK